MQGARQALARIFVTDPSNGHAWAVLGQMDEAAGDFDAALECFRRGAEDPGTLELPRFWS
jgi:cytochrome c-type biogenesis protein CcmH/NrfG